VVDVCVFCCHGRLKGCLFAYLDDRTLEVVEMPGSGLRVCCCMGCYRSSCGFAQPPCPDSLYGLVLKLREDNI
jgi:hypothetical protein